MADFDRLRRHLDERFPNTFNCRLGRNGESAGLLIKSPSRDGHAFLSEFAKDGSALLALYESAEDNNPEVWTINQLEEAAQRIHPWAFPSEWHRPPSIDVTQSRADLEKLAAGLFKRIDNVECRVVTSNHNLLRLLTDSARKQLEQDVESVRAERIISNFPADESGNLLLKTAVVLRRYEITESPGTDRDVCLAATGPEMRSDDQLIKVQLLDVILSHQDYRWDSCQWLWDDMPVPDEYSWGSDAVIEDATAMAHLSDESVNRLSPRSRAEYAVWLLDTGFIEESFRLYDIELSDDLHKILGGQRIAPPHCCTHPDDSWRSLLIKGLRQAAPWLLPGMVANETRRLQDWVAAKAGRNASAPMLRLFVFPGQFHSRKASVVITANVDGTEPRLEIENVSNDARLHESAWKRPLAVELARFGVRTLEPA